MPSPARAIFSSEDFRLLRTAVAYYLKEARDAPDLDRLGHLYHRLGRPG